VAVVAVAGAPPASAAAADRPAVPPAGTVAPGGWPALPGGDRKLCNVQRARRRKAGPRRRAPRRVAVIASGLAVLGLASGCAKFNAALGKQEVVVQFQAGTAEATRLKVRAACSHIPNSRPEPLPTDHLASDNLYNVIYRVDQADDAQLAELYQCLQRYPAVAGITTQTPDGG
jgi:hypothetical protein